jgi:hypothetical protein
LAISAATTNPIYQSSLESNSKDVGKVYMVGNGEPPPAKTTKVIQQEAGEELARATYLARELDKGKGHNGLQDDSGVSEDEPRDGAPSRRHALSSTLKLVMIDL